MAAHPFLKKLLIAGVVFVLIGGCFLTLASTVTYEPFGVPEVLRDEYKQKVADITAKQIVLRSSGSALTAKAVVDNSVHDFGLMDPLSMGEYEFVVRNDGEIDLVLTGGETTCKCTLVRGASQIVEPGAEAKIRLTWNSGRKKEYYQQKARIRTNDPLMPEIDLTIKGRVRFEVATSTDEIYLANLKPDGEASEVVDVYSQLFYEFEITKIESSLDPLVWQVEPLQPVDLQNYDARSGYRLKLRLPLKEFESYISGLLRLHISHPEVIRKMGIEASADADVPEPEFGEEPSGQGMLVREIPIRGQVPKRIALFGAGLHRHEGMELGVLPRGQRVEKKLILRTRGDRLPKELRIAVVEPSFVDVQLKAKEGKDDLYDLVIVIPEDAPMAIFNTAQDRGKIEIVSDLLVNGSLVVPLSGAIVEEKEKS